MFRKFVLGAIVASAIAVSAQAATITGLWDTGVDASGNKYTSDGQTEIHYLVNGTTGYTYQNGAWVNASDARWIAASSNGTYTINPGIYTLSFTLDGLDPATAQLSGLFAIDDGGSVQLNGGTAINTQYGYGGLTSFSFTSGFVSGVNTLTFKVIDTGGAPAGLVVSNLHGTASVAAVPEPASWAMMITGFGLVGATMRRRRETLAHA